MGTLIYIGSLSPMDTDESNRTNENPDAISGSYSAGDMQTVDVDMTNSGGYVYSDDAGQAPDEFIYDIGGGETRSGLDAEARFTGTVTDENGVTSSVTMSVYQTQNGDTFVRLPDGYDVRELTVDSMVGDGYSNIYSSASSTSAVVCFHAGMRILTPEGERPVQGLRPGDLVMTLDSGPQAIRWVDRWNIDKTKENNAPICIVAGAFGAGIPKRDLRVSPHHRLYLTSRISERMFGTPGVLIAARRLLGLPGVYQDPIGQEAAYVHFLCDQHELVLAEGVAAETLLVAAQSIAMLDEAISVGVAEAAAPLTARASAPARPLHSQKRLQKMIGRHIKNGKMLRACTDGFRMNRSGLGHDTTQLSSLTGATLPEYRDKHAKSLAN